MGRRSINTTKSGKYMNPTDQASKYIWSVPLLHFFFTIIIFKGKCLIDSYLNDNAIYFHLIMAIQK